VNRKVTPSTETSTRKVSSSAPSTNAADGCSFMAHPSFKSMVGCERLPLPPRSPFFLVKVLNEDIEPVSLVPDLHSSSLIIFAGLSISSVNETTLRRYASFNSSICCGSLIFEFSKHCKYYVTSFFQKSTNSVMFLIPKNLQDPLFLCNHPFKRLDLPSLNT
jgi:hypothetical protein